MKKQENYNNLDFMALLKSTEKNGNMTPLEVVNNSIFEFVCDDEEMEALFTTKALEVCNAILTGQTFKYIENKDNYVWYQMMMQTSFFKEAVDYGVSIRGAWLDKAVLKNSILYNEEGVQCFGDIVLNREGATKLVQAMIDYSVENKLVMLSK